MLNMAVDIRVDTVMRLIGQYDADTTVNGGSPYRGIGYHGLLRVLFFQPGGMV